MNARPADNHSGAPTFTRIEITMNRSDMNAIEYVTKIAWS